MKPSTQRSRAQVEKPGGVALVLSLEINQDHERGISSRQAHQPPPYGRSSLPLEHTILGKPLRVSTHLTAMQPSQDCPIPQGRTDTIAMRVQSRNDQPRVHRPIHQLDINAATPQLEKRSSESVLCFVMTRTHPPHRTEHRGLMLIEQRSERSRLTRTSASP